MKSINDALNHLYETINKWLISLDESYGIEPKISLTIFACLIIVFLVICANARRKKISKVEKQSQEGINGLSDKIMEVSGQLEKVTESFAKTDNRLEQVEEMILELDERLEDKKDTEPKVDKKTGEEISMGKVGSIRSDIIYIDCRQTKDEPSKSVEEVRNTVESVISGLAKREPERRPIETKKDLNGTIEPKEIENTSLGSRAIYDSRTSGLSKNGTEYTLEQLNQQIKE